MIGLPPLLDGALNATETAPGEGVSPVTAGLPGATAGGTSTLAPEALSLPVPTALVALTLHE